MAAEKANHELTTTLHLGIRSVVGDSPSSALTQFIDEASDEVAAAISSTLAGDGKSAMVFIHRGPSKGARFLITSDGAAIGRAPESEIFLDDITVSRRHAVIEKSEMGFSFKDQGSLNGSYINNEIAKEVTLRSGDEIQIGKFHLLFVGAATQGEK
jgi:hypothetical protein